MAIKTDKLGGTDWVDGLVLYSEDLVNTFDATTNNVLQVYTGTGFNSSVVYGSNTSDTQDHEMDVITSSNIVGCNYLIIKIFFGSSISNSNDSSGVYTRLKIQTKDVGGSYSDSMSYRTVHSFGSSLNDSASTGQGKSIIWYHTLTTDEKNNGVQVKIFSASYCGNNSSSSLSNYQTVLMGST